MNSISLHRLHLHKRFNGCRFKYSSSLKFFFLFSLKSFWNIPMFLIFNFVSLIKKIISVNSIQYAGQDSINIRGRYCLSLMVQTLAESEIFFFQNFILWPKNMLFGSLKTIIHFYLLSASQLLALKRPTQWKRSEEEWAKFETDCKMIAAVRHLSYSVYRRNSIELEVYLTPCN